MKIELEGKVAIVTGAARGIGRGIAEKLCQSGAVVILTDILDLDGKKTEQELSRFGQCVYHHCDVTNKAQVEQVIESVKNQYESIDLFINNAGVNIGTNRVNIDQFSDQEWERLIKVDMDGVFYCSRAVSRYMIQQKSGRIINIGSVMGHVPARKQIGFVAAKGAVHNMTRAMALELAPYGILVNCVAPGSIQMDINLFSEKDSAMQQMRERMLSHVPLGRFGSVEDIANAVFFLCGKESSYITGIIMLVDGGWTCGYSRDF